jgi:hypothetical protein
MRLLFGPHRHSGAGPARGILHLEDDVGVAVLLDLALGARQAGLSRRRVQIQPSSSLTGYIGNGAR